MLEPIAGPRLGAFLNGVAAVLALGLTALSATVTTLNGVVPMILLAPLVAIGFGIRAIGATYAASQGVRAMPWTPRVLSWIALGAAAALLGFGGSLLVVAGFGAFVAIDAATALVKREEKERPLRTGPSLWSRVKIPLFVALWLGGVAAFHLLVGLYLPYGTLITWTLLALGFALLVRGLLNGPKASETWLRAPLDHRAHERREEVVLDPHRARADEVLLALRQRGDAGAFLEFVRDAARAADIPDPERATLESRILASFARAGTRRDEDVRAALAEIESTLKLRKEVRT